MTRDKSNDDFALDRLAESLVDDILNMTDEEMLAEITADGENPERIAQDARNVFERAVMTCRKAKLTAAKKAVLSDRQQSSKIFQLDPGVARQKLDKILKQHPETRNKLTLAARNEGDLSDRDISSMLQDFEELGVISPINKKDENG